MLEVGQFDELINTNLKAPLFITQAAAPLLRDNGTIINIVDIHGQLPLKDYLAYTLTKAGLDMLVRGLAAELAPRIRVNGVAPGAILWPESEAEMSSADRQLLLDRIPMGRIGEAEDIAEAVLFLARGNSFVTGQVLRIDGGQSLGSA